MTPLSEAEASAVWAVLVEHAGANGDNWERDSFVHCQSTNVEREWRFQGSLGFGGKFRRQRVWVGTDSVDARRWRGEIWLVDCYAEDLTPARQNIIDATNAALAELRKERPT